MVAGVGFISFSAIAVRLSAASPVTVAFFRAAYALPPLYLLKTWVWPSAPRPGRSRVLGLVAGLALAGDFSAWHVAIELMGAGLATVVGAVHVVTTMLVGWLALKQRPTLAAVLATPVVLFGTVLIAGIVGSGARGDDPVAGVGFGLLTAVLYTTYIILLRQAGTTSTSPVAPLFDATLGAAVGALILSPLDGGFSLIPMWPAHAWIAALALGSQVAGWLLISWGLPKIDAWEASMLLVLQPAGTVLWAYLIFGEVFSVSQWVGILLVIVGVATVASPRRARRAAAPSGPRPGLPRPFAETAGSDSSPPTDRRD
jgi:drug/metabolite transporter (DMT)-like permease